MLLEKYCPKNSREIIGNRLACAELAGFLKQWKKGQAALLAGESGTGKSLAARTIAQELGYEIVWLGADEERRQKDMQSFIAAAKQAGMVRKKKVFIVDELDQMESGKAVSALIDASEHPVILIAGDLYDKKLYGMRQRCKVIKFSRVRWDSVAKFLSEISAKEGLEIDARCLEQVAQASGGDVRAALIDLETLCAGNHEAKELGHREHPQGMFGALKVVFKTADMENALIAMNSADDPEELCRWIAENISEEYGDIEDIARAYDMASKADIFHARIIRRQSWSLQKYFLELSAAGVALAKKSHSGKFVNYARPRFRPGKGAEPLQKIARKLHVSSRRAAGYRQLLRQLSKNRKMLDELGITRDELKEI